MAHGEEGLGGGPWEWSKGGEGGRGHGKERKVAKGVGGGVSQHMRPQESLRGNSSGPQARARGTNGELTAGGRGGRDAELRNGPALTKELQQK